MRTRRRGLESRRARCTVAIVASLVSLFPTGCWTVGQPGSTSETATRAPAAFPPDIQEAIDFRIRLGMSSDVDLVRGLASDPAAVRRGGLSGFGIPITQAELTALRRRTDLRHIASVGHAYGLAHPEDFAGDFIDQKNHRYVFLATARQDDHRAALLAELPAGSPFVVEEAQSTVVQLESLRDRVRDDEEIFSSLGVRYVGLSVLEQENVVEVTVISADPSTESRILEHFGNPPHLRVRVLEGASPPIGFGSVIVRLVDAGGEPVTPRDVLCQLADRESGRNLDREELAPVDGRCRFTHVAVGDVEARIIRDGGDRRVLARNHGVVRLGGEVRITVTID